MKLVSYLIVVFSVFFISFNGQAQHVNYYQLDSLSDDELKKGDVLVDFFYGGPNLNYVWLEILLPNLTNGSTSTSNVKNEYVKIGPLGMHLDYMLDDKNSIGIDFNYSFTEVRNTYNSNVSSSNVRVTNVGTYERFRFIPRYCYHFRTDKLDVFYHVGIGTVKNNIKFVDGLTFETSDGDWLKRAISIRTGVGLRYSLTKNWGIAADFGLGGPLLTFGINARL